MAVKRLRDHGGRSIRLTAERLGHIEDHPEMAGLEGAIGETLVEPEIVVRSRVDSRVHLYHRFYRGTRVGDKYLCVVVKMREDDPFVLTAYLTDKIRRGEILWHAKS